MLILPLNAGMAFIWPLFLTNETMKSMKRIFTPAILGCLLFAATSVNAQMEENFNSRPAATLPMVKAHLENQCWIFVNTNINSMYSISALEGDGAMVISNNSGAELSGIYTPVMEVPGRATIRFKYSFDVAPTEPVKMKIYITDAYNEVLMELDEITLNPAGGEHNKNYTKLGSGIYKFLFEYIGPESSKMIFDDLQFTYARKYYTYGCNTPPVATDDVFVGTETRHASGNVTDNDYETDPGEFFWAYLIEGSPHGTVTLDMSGEFTFVPNPGFTGDKTTFTYQICDEGYPSMCSNIATVTINFPSNSSLPVSLIDFTGVYKNDGLVELTWTTNFESNSDKFIVERSIDGVNWEAAGSVAAQGYSTIQTKYRFEDQAGKKVALKSDLFYRLKQLDKDGRTFISKVLMVRVMNKPAVKMVSVTPNPAKNDITVTVTLNESAMTAMKVRSANGMEIKNKTIKAGPGTGQYMIEGTSGLTPGLYFLEVVINSKERMVIKLIKE